jgi:diguanylate cyclase (GGDEF)-like protein
MLGHLFMALALRRDWPLTTAGLTIAELQLPLMAVAALARPGIAGARQLGTWWEWVPPTIWAAVAATALTADRWMELPPMVLVGAAAALLMAVIRFAFTVRSVGRRVQHRDMSLTDELTGLPNRHVLFQQLALLTHSRGASGEEATLLVLGIDNFRSLNDTLGHHAGDRLLAIMAGRLSAELAEDGVLMRMSGDEFAAILRAPVDPDAVTPRLLRSVEQPFDVSSINVSLSASIGMARFPADAVEGRELARRAEVAMSDAKRRRVGYAYYADAQDQDAIDQLSLADDLRRALATDDGSLWVAFQPQLDVTSGTIHGAEALLRWSHPTRGTVPPDQLLPIAERSGLLTPLTDWMLEQTVSAAARLVQSHGAHLRFAVNVSAATLVDLRLPHRIDQALIRHGVSPLQLVVEVTEDALMSDQQRCLQVVERIAALGVEVAIDDFGTGHSTLSQLRNLPANELKIDRAFVQAMTTDLLDAEIVRLIVRMGRQVGLRVVAEGVETTKERRMLADFGCSVLQGYGISKPLPYAEFAAFLAGHSSGTAPFADAA